MQPIKIEGTEVTMKQFTISVTLLVTLLLNSCSQKENHDSGKSLEHYFALTEQGVQNGNVKMIPIETPKGTFNVWTKRFGNNPRMKLLLLHGGPGATHEYWECMENFLPLRRGLSLFITTSWVPPIPTNRKTLLCGI